MSIAETAISRRAPGVLPLGASGRSLPSQPDVRPQPGSRRSVAARPASVHGVLAAGHGVVARTRDSAAFLQAPGVVTSILRALSAWPTPMPDYTIMNWWDQGYVIQRARRVPVSNPTQERAPNAARFYAETDETRARRAAARERSRSCLRLGIAVSARAGRSMRALSDACDWAGATHATTTNPLPTIRGMDAGLGVSRAVLPQMTFRLAVLGGKRNAGEFHDGRDVPTAPTRGFPFRGVVTERTFPTYDEAVAMAASVATTCDSRVWIPATAFPIRRSVTTSSATHRGTEAGGAVGADLPGALAVFAKHVVHPERSGKNGVSTQPFDSEEAPDEAPS